MQQQAIRNTQGRFVKGNPGGPGRPPGSLSPKKALTLLDTTRKQLRRDDWHPVIRLAEICETDPDLDTKDRIEILEFLAPYYAPRLKQLDVTAHTAHHAHVESFPSEQERQALEAAQRHAAESARAECLRELEHRGYIDRGEEAADKMLDFAQDFGEAPSIETLAKRMPPGTTADEVIAAWREHVEPHLQGEQSETPRTIHVIPAASPDSAACLPSPADEEPEPVPTHTSAPSGGEMPVTAADLESLGLASEPAEPARPSERRETVRQRNGATFRYSGGDVV